MILNTADFTWHGSVAGLYGVQDLPISTCKGVLGGFAGFMQGHCGFAAGT